MLYLVPTPIGNLEDVSPRIISTLTEVDLILSEDTRNTGKLLKLLNIENKQKSFHAHNEHHQVQYIIDLLQSGQKIAMVTDAGTPGISDPGYLLVHECHSNNINVSCLPGPTAFVPALAASGLPSDKFFFEGFLPQKKGRKTRMEYLAELPHTFILYESPYRLIKCLGEISLHCGPERRVAVAREISKIHEEIIQKEVQEMITEFESRPSVKGEIVIIVEGKKVEKSKKKKYSEDRNK